MRDFDMGKVLEAIRLGLIVSCQAHGDHPLRDPSIMAAMASCAQEGGAAGIRADGPEDIREIRASVTLPIIGIYKVPTERGRYFITPTLEHASEVVDAGADIVALDATFEFRPDKGELEELTRRVREELGVPVMTDVSTVEEGVRAIDVGTELVATTLSGHTRASRGRVLPDLDLIAELSSLGIRVVCEGHVQTPGQAERAFENGAWSVVVGTAITDPVAMTFRFVEAARGHRGDDVSGEGMST